MFCNDTEYRPKINYQYTQYMVVRWEELSSLLYVHDFIDNLTTEMTLLSI